MNTQTNIPKEFHDIKERTLIMVLKWCKEYTTKNKDDILSKAVAFDKDIEGVVDAWNSLDFTYTAQSHSGTPKDHAGKYAAPKSDNPSDSPYGWILAFAHKSGPVESFVQGMRDLGFEVRNETPKQPYSFIRKYPRIEDLAEIELKAWVPQEIIKSGDQFYLNKKWDELQKYLHEFRGHHQ